MTRYEKSIIDKALAEVAADVVTVVFKSGRGRIAINPRKFFPATVKDTKTLCTALDTADNNDGAAALVDYSRRCVEALRELREECKDILARKGVALECSAMIKRYTAAANFLAERYGLDKIDADGEAVKMRRCVVYSMRDHGMFIQQFDGWTFEKFGRTFTAYKYSNGLYVVLLPRTGSQVAIASTYKEIPAAVTRETIEMIDKNAENVESLERRMMELLPTACRDINGELQHIDITPEDIFGADIPGGEKSETVPETPAPEAKPEKKPEKARKVKKATAKKAAKAPQTGKTPAPETPQEAPQEAKAPEAPQTEKAPETAKTATPQPHKMTINELREAVETMLRDFDERTGNQGADSVLSDPETWTGTAGQFMKLYGAAAKILLACDSATKPAKKSAA